MGIWRRLRCIFSPRSACVQWDANQDDTIRYLRSEKQSAEAAAANLRHSRLTADPITRVYGGWDREERTR